MEQREKFGSRLGFILISAGCAIGLGNVWKFPWLCGQNGGAAFIIVYLLCLVALGLPIMAMEFTIGRAAQKGLAKSLDVLEPKNSKWHVYKYFGMAGNYLLMMFYTMVGGWMLNYVFKMGSGSLNGADADLSAEAFGSMVSSAGEMWIWMIVALALGLLVCALGLKNGVERITKAMMLCLLAIMVVLAVRSITLSDAGEGLSFYLAPDFSIMFASPSAFVSTVYAALAQSFFTLSIGIGSMLIFGSYISKDRALFGESITIGALDTFVAIVAGLIIFPACFAFGISPDAGPSLVFQTLPCVFAQMWGGQVWGTLFFVFMSFAALSTIVAVYENIISFWMDSLGWSRKKAVLINCILLPILCTPCVLGFNVWAGFDIPFIGGIMDLEDFIVSNNLLPIGSLIFVLFCVSKKGWGWDNFMAECNTGKGLKFPEWLHGWMKWGAPIIIVVILVFGWLDKFGVLTLLLG